jgi:hypothetical protein
LSQPALGGLLLIVIFLSRQFAVGIFASNWVDRQMSSAPWTLMIAETILQNAPQHLNLFLRRSYRRAFTLKTGLGGSLPGEIDRMKLSTLYMKIWP